MSKLRIFLLSTILALGLTSCGYQGFYRYPCQNPENWEKAECNPPICEASGTCTKDMIKPSTESNLNTTGGTNNG
jgi:hypothetical protein